MKQAPLSLLPVNESKSDPESEVNLFMFPDSGEASCARNSIHSPLLPPARMNSSSARMNSSSSDHEHQDIKKEPLEGLNAPLDPNDEFDLRNGVLRSDISDCLPSSSGSEGIIIRPERKVITEEDVLSFKEKAHCWACTGDVLDMMEDKGIKNTRPNVVVSKKAFADVLFHSRPAAFDIGEYIKAFTDSIEIGRKELELRLVALEAQETTKICSTRIELEQLKEEYDTKLRDLNLRIQVSAALEGGTKDTSKQLDAALSDNVKLQEKVRKLEHILRGVRDNSNILTIPSHVEAPVHPSDPSRESSTSSSSSIVDVKDSQKRDLSPPSHLKRNGPAKKPKSEIWHTWNRNGTRVVTAWGVDTLRIILHGMAKPDLVALSAKASAAAENFKSLFPLDNDPE